MSSKITAQGSYNSPKTKQDVNFEFDYDVIDNVSDAISLLGEDKVKSLIQRMIKLDASNIAREKAKSENGDSTRKAMTEEQKAEAKAERKANAELLKILKDKGLTAQDIASL
jgi:hypothetical protein